MFGAAIIVLRETLEAALLIGIVAAATRTIPGSQRWVTRGIALGLLGALIVASLTGRIAALFDGVGQDVFNAAILGLAVILLGWHQVWMSSHGRELAASARQVGQDLTEGRRHMSAILVVIGLAVLREGAETALFLYGMLSGGDVTSASIGIGGAMGLLAGAALGYGMYAGMLKIPLRWFFSATSVLILLLAGGMASKMTGFLIQADLLPSLRSPLWDTSSVLPLDSVAGTFMHALAGYEPAPAAMQVISYVAVMAIILCGMALVGRHSNARSAA